MDNPELLPRNKALYNTWCKKLPDGKSAVFSGVTDSKISKSSAIQTLIWFENLSWLMDSLWIPEKQGLSWRKNVSVLDSGPEILLPMDPDCLTWAPHHDWESNIPFVLRKWLKRVWADPFPNENKGKQNTKVHLERSTLLPAPVHPKNLKWPKVSP